MDKMPPTLEDTDRGSSAPLSGGQQTKHLSTRWELGLKWGTGKLLKPRRGAMWLTEEEQAQQQRRKGSAWGGPALSYSYSAVQNWGLGHRRS